MSNGITLPALNVRAVSSAFSSFNTGGAPPMQSPAAVLVALHPRRLQHYAQGYWREMIIMHMEEVVRQTEIGWRYAPTWDLQVDMLKISLADKYMSSNPHALAAQAISQALSGWGYRKKISDARELSGGVLTPFAAWSHYMTGGGAAVTTNLNRLGLKLSSTKIPALESLFAAAIVGTSPVSLQRVVYNTGLDSHITWAWLGHITLKIEGTLHKTGGGQITFDGVARAYHDTYDFNASTHRSEIGEKATAGGRQLDRIIKGTPYEIIIEGELPINIQR